MSSQDEPTKAIPDPSSDPLEPASASAVTSETIQESTRKSSISLAPLTSLQPQGTAATSSLSPGATDRVFPIRSVVSMNATPTPSTARQDRVEGYFPNLDLGRSRRQSETSGSESSRSRAPSGDQAETPRASEGVPSEQSGSKASRTTLPRNPHRTMTKSRLPAQVFSDIASARSGDSESLSGAQNPSQSASVGERSIPSRPNSIDGGLVTARFQHVVTEGGHAIVTGRDGETLQRCEDEPIHVPGAVQGFGFLLALQEEPGTGHLLVRIVSENSRKFIGRTPRQLFALKNFCDILSEEQADNLLDHIDFIRDEDTDVETNGPEVFTMSIKMPEGRPRKLWCAMHMNDANPGFIICEFELEDDHQNPLVPSDESTPELPEDTLDSRPTPEQLLESTQTWSRPLRVLRSARKRKGEAAAMEVFNIMSQVQEQLATAPNLETFLRVLVGVVKELTGFHRVMIYQFDHQFNGRVVTELVDPRATRDLYKGLNFPASDIPKQARDLYKINRVRLLYDRDQETARLVCRTVEDLERPLDLTHAYLRAMSPIHLKYLKNMAVRSSMSISINAFGELWGLIACHTYGGKGMRVSFPIRKMCRLVGDSACRNIERLSYASRLQARKLINTAPTQHNPSGYIIASSDDLLKLFDADFGLLSIRDETKILGHLEQSQEALALLEYMRMRAVTSVITSQDISGDFPDLNYGPGFSIIAGMLAVPLSVSGRDFILFFRKGHLKEVSWAGNPYEKFIREGTEGYLEPRKSFKTWTETVVGKSREWTEEEIETAAVLCLVYGKFIEVWRQKEAALQNSQLTRLLLANSAHEVRTPLNAIINYLEIALEGSLDQETRDNLSKSHSASKSLIYVINDLLDLTKTVEGGDLVKGEIFDLRATLKEATEMFEGDARRKNISYEVVQQPEVPQNVIGDPRKIRQAIANITANAIQNTSEGSVRIEMYVAAWEANHVDIEVVVQDTGSGMSGKKLDALFRELEQVQSEGEAMPMEEVLPKPAVLDGAQEKRTLGLGLAVVSRIIRNMNGQLRLKSEEGKGSRFVVTFPFDLPASESRPASFVTTNTPKDSTTPQSERPPEGEVTLVQRDSQREQARSNSSQSMTRKNSANSLNSHKSMKSFTSASSHGSQMSDVDRLIEAIQEPHGVGTRPNTERRVSARSSKSWLENRLSFQDEVGASERPRARSLEPSDLEAANHLPHLRSPTVASPGEEILPFSGTPLRAVRMPDEFSSPSKSKAVPSPSRILGEVASEERMVQAPESLDSKNMRVLVAEDDPINSRIVKKRLEKAGHDIHLTINGEECASVYGDGPEKFDVVLMDMQMPIVDGLTSTKMIRSYEKLHSITAILSPRAKLNGRVPIIAVSASLEEKHRQRYIDAGFDAWILKPISFTRLSELMDGIVNEQTKESCLYQPGQWERGGWFHGGNKSALDVETTPSGQPPTDDASTAEAEIAQPDIKAVVEGSGDSDKVRQELLAQQDKGKAKEEEPREASNEPTSEG